MGKKKKKNIIAKRRAQSKDRKQKKRKSGIQRSKSNVQFIDRPAISEIEAPVGFRTVSMTQGMIEYAKPIMDFVEKGIVKD
ncbi:MAG: hypothetical protein FVQ80_18585, partial [Planctomycetes bacterium]|nr:hypothetical protein [Planctomycetota bacterium]